MEQIETHQTNLVALASRGVEAIGESPMVSEGLPVL